MYGTTLPQLALVVASLAGFHMLRTNATVEASGVDRERYGLLRVRWNRPHVESAPPREG